MLGLTEMNILMLTSKMAMDMVYIIFVLSILRLGKGLNVELVGQEYVQKGSPIKLSCSSTSVPVGRTAEFLTTRGTVANIRSHNGLCFNTLNSTVCTNTSCMCNNDGRMYVLFYTPSVFVSRMQFQCKVKFNDNRIHLSNPVIVSVLDMIVPKIQLHDSPYISGMTVKVQCITRKTNADVTFSWQCGVGIQRQIERNDTSVWSILQLKVDSSYDGMLCICKIRSRRVNFSLSDSVFFKVQKLPILTLNDEFHCNDTDNLVLVCSVMGELGMFGFDPWIHSVNGVYIRSLQGVKNNFVSLLMMHSCSLEDYGDYTCSVWNQDLNETLWENKTTHLNYNGPAIILNNKTTRSTNEFALDTTFYSDSLPRSIDLYCKDNALSLFENNSRLVLEQILVDLNIHGKTVEIPGYRYQISTAKKDCIKGKNSFCIENEFSKKCMFFEFTKPTTDFSFTTSWLLFTGIAVVILISVGIPIIVCIAWQRKSKADFTVQHEIIAPEENYNRELPRINVNTVAQSREQHDFSNTIPRPYLDLEPYQSSRVYRDTIPEYLEVLPDLDTVSKASDGYETVE